jgi:hypothetical protein
MKTTSCFNEFVESLKEKITFNDGIRAWKHNKGNVTQWHYDGNGINIFNICISGRKRFYLSPPGSIPVLPLSNISLKTDIWDEQSVFVEIGVSDMLYLPPYWFHKVITLEDNTLTVNYAFYIIKIVYLLQIAIFIYIHYMITLIPICV